MLRHASVRLDNPAIVPASLLPRRAEYQQLANALPRGQVLIILPAQDGSQKATLQKVATHLRGKGQPVTTVAGEDFPSGCQQQKRPPQQANQQLPLPGVR